MRICRFGDRGSERPGLLDGDGRLRDLSPVCRDIDGHTLSPDGLDALRRIRMDDLPLVEGSPRLGIPVQGTSKMICIGLNYTDHAAEAGLAVPVEPVVFLKATTALGGPNDDILQPRGSTKLDWEVELGVVIGSTARYLDESEALRHVAGYCVVNDVSERAFQLQSSQWDKGKGCDSFGPVGPWLVTADEVPDPQDLSLWLTVNGVRRQSGTTRDMVFGVARLVAYCSRYMTLLPGDIIATGTPAGVGMGIKPDPVWLHPGDVVELGIAGLGQQRQCVVEA